MIDELRTFVAVAAAGSIHGAARRVPLTQSAITRQIQRLESHLDCQLFDRSVKPPRLTRAGEQALLLGKTLLGQVGAFRESFGPGAIPTGPLRVGVAHAFLDWDGGRPVADAIGAFMRMFPQVTLRLAADWTPSLLAELKRGGLDAAIVIARPGAHWPSAATVTPVATDQLVAVAPQSFGFTRRCAFERLFEHPWILNPDGCGYRALVTSMAAASGQTMRIAAEVHGAALQYRLVAAGFGVGFVPLSVARHWQALTRSPTRLTIIKPAGQPFVITAVLITNTRSEGLSAPVDWLGSRLNAVLAARKIKRRLRVSERLALST